MDNWEEQREKIIGLGKSSMRKSYYPQLKNRLKELENFKKILDYSLDGILLIQLPELTIHDFNAVVIKLLGMQRNKLHGAPLSEILKAEDLQSIESFIHDNTRLSLNEYRITLQKEDSVHTLELNLNKPEHNESLMVAIIRDITNRVRREHELKIAKEAAEAASLAKTEFLAVMSHELRTPLNPIIGFTEMLQMSITSNPESDYLGLVKDSALKQLELIDKILTYSQIEHGNINPNFEWVELYQTCELSLRGFGASFPAIDLEFHFGSAEIPLDSALLVHSDKSILSQILENLIGNACKYTRQGKVTLNITSDADHDKDGTHFIEFEIVDTGIGIAEEKKADIFEAFTQADTSYKRNYDGVGLGLAVVKKLVEALHGSVSIESELEVGSTFTVRLPLKTSIPQPTAGSTTSSNDDRYAPLSKPCSILVFEDIKENAIYIEALLSQMGATFTITESPTKGLELSKENSYDLILMDLSMPDTDGFECSSIIKTQDGPNQNTPILAISAHTDPKTKNKSKEFGMVAFIEKPINPDQLLQTIETALTNQH